MAIEIDDLHWFTQLQNGDISHSFLYVYSQAIYGSRPLFGGFEFTGATLTFCGYMGAADHRKAGFLFFFFLSVVALTVTWLGSGLWSQLYLRHFKDVLGVLMRYFMSNCRYLLINYHRCLVLLDVLMIFDQISSRLHVYPFIIPDRVARIIV